MKIMNVRFLIPVKVNGGPDDYDLEYMAECEVDQGGHVQETRIYRMDDYDNGDGPALPREEWGKEVEAKLPKIEARAIEKWRRDPERPNKGLLIVGGYSLKDWNRHQIWIENEAGEGMAVDDKDFTKVLDSLFSEKF